MSLHGALSEQVVTDFGERLADLPRLTHDALLLRFDTGLEMQVRYVNVAEYALRWTYQGRQLCIDTAPLHTGLASFPQHLHSADGRVLADPITRPGVPAWDNLRNLIRSVLDDPLLQAAADR